MGFFGRLVLRSIFCITIILFVVFEVTKFGTPAEAFNSFVLLYGLLVAYSMMNDYISGEELD